MRVSPAQPDCERLGIHGLRRAYPQRPAEHRHVVDHRCPTGHCRRQRSPSRRAGRLASAGARGRPARSCSSSSTSDSVRASVCSLIFGAPNRSARARKATWVWMSSVQCRPNAWRSTARAAELGPQAARRPGRGSKVSPARTPRFGSAAGDTHQNRLFCAARPRQSRQRQGSCWFIAGVMRRG